MEAGLVKRILLKIMRD